MALNYYVYTKLTIIKKYTLEIKNKKVANFTHGRLFKSYLIHIIINNNQCD